MDQTKIAVLKKLKTLRDELNNTGSEPWLREIIFKIDEISDDLEDQIAE